jgi:hypothetical protein
VALNHYHDNGEGYWNADGFVAEGGVHNLRFIGCKAFDNTDGGSGDDLGLWTNSVVTAEQCTFHDNGTNISPVDGGQVVLTRSILSQSKARRGNLSSGGVKSGSVKLVETIYGTKPKRRAKIPTIQSFATVGRPG